MYRKLFTPLKCAMLTALVCSAAVIASDFAFASEARGGASAGDASGLVINEIMAANVDRFVDPSYNYGGWIEIYNPTSDDVSLYGCYVSDDETNPKMFRLITDVPTVPAGGYALLWFDHYEELYSQINFKLNTNGGTILLSDADGNIICQETYPKAFTRCSWARTTDGGADWSWTADATPGATNNGATYCTERTDAPTVTPDGQLFDTLIRCYVTAANDRQKVYYTTDGTTPTPDNGTEVQNGGMNILANTTLRFRAYEDGKLPSTVVTRSYILNDQNYTLPIISVTTDPDNLYDNIMGCMVKGNNPLSPAGRGQTSACNWNNDWDRPVNFEFILPEEGAVINQEADLSICGGWSRAYTPHSFKLKAGKLYEDMKTFEYPFFHEKPYLKHKTLQIRNGGNDYTCMFKDPALMTIARTAGLNIDNQCYQPVLHFFNGTFNGLINMREPNNKDYAYANYGYDSDEIDQFEIGPDSCYTQMRGTKDAFNLWYDLAASCSDDAVYEQIKEIVDIDSYIYYMAVESYLGGTDWPRNNVKGFRKTDGGRFRFVLFDVDGALATTSPFSSIESQEYAYGDADYNNGGNRLYNHNEFVTIWLNMLQNADFRRRFMDALSVVGGSAYEQSRVTAILDSLRDQANPGLALDGRSCYSTYSSLKSSLTSSRLTSILNSMKNYSKFNLSSTTMQTVTMSQSHPAGRMFINDEEVVTGSFTGGLFAPVTFRAEAPAGYKFVGWKGTKTETKTTTTPGGGGGGGGWGWGYETETSSGIDETDQTIVLEQKSKWRYYDQGSLDGTDWYKDDFNDASWTLGQAPLGFANSTQWGQSGNIYDLVVTQLDYGTDSYNKRPTYYFRNTFNLPDDPVATTAYYVNYGVDDGCIVYVNGNEVGTYNISSGAKYSDYAYTYAGSTPDYGQLEIPAKYLQKGTNVIAVEVHNSSATSSDIFWECSVGYIGGAGSGETGGGEEEEGEYLSTSATYTMPTGYDITMEAVYEPMTEEELAEAGIVNPVVINEVSAANTVFQGEYFKRNDWIELYNTTDEEIDLAGYYLSDNVEKPTKYQIPTDGSVDTKIPAHGYRVVWCDKLDNTATELHTSFKLAAEGGDVMIMAPDESWSDVFNYVTHGGDETVGRYPDGTANCYHMSRPTPGKTNVLTAYTVEYTPEIHEPVTSVSQQIEQSLAEMKLHYAGETLYVRGPETGEVQVDICNAAGQRVMRRTLHFDCGICALSLRSLPAGCYVVRAQSRGAKNAGLKVVR